MSDHRRKPGEAAPPFTLPAVGGATFESRSLLGRNWLLSFQRYATWPTWVLTVRQFAADHAWFEEAGIALVRVFHSPLFALDAVFAEEPPPFPILSDPDKVAYKAFGVERSIRSLLHRSALHRVKESREEHLKPRWRDAIRDGFTGLPADFLVDAEGLLRRVHYGADFTDSLSVPDAQEWVRALAGS